MFLISRVQWGARAPKNRTPLVKSEQRGTALHYTSMDSDEQSDHMNCAGRVRNIQDYHMDGRGWADIAYSFIGCKHGYVFEGRGIGIRTAGQGTTAGNDAYHAVCFLGNDTVNRDDVTDRGRQALRDAITHCNNWSAAREVQPHSHFHATGCPGDQLRRWIIAGLPAPNNVPFPPWPGRYLALRTPMMHGADVKQYQSQMYKRGWSLSVDGYYGAMTEHITRLFQQEKGLTIDGIVGPTTWKAAFTLVVT